tara:strand:- start:1709 stop:2230 length:522 start_codon:yes stop_codon:yes gene_type:complete
MSKYNMFDRPIPGQSLTDEPANYPWEHPAKMNKVEDIMMQLMEKFSQKENVENLASMLKADVPVEAIARVILFAGFTEGKWSVDLAILAAEPLMKMIVATGARLGIEELVVTMDSKNKTNIGNELLVRKEMDKASASIKEEAKNKEEEPENINMPQSLMAKTKMDNDTEGELK